MTNGSGAPGHTSRWFWPCLLVGWAVIGIAIRGLVVESDRTNPKSFAEIFIGLDLGHDLLLAPLVLVTAFLVGQLGPKWAANPVRAGLAATGIIVVYAYPLVIGAGRSPRAGPSRLPLNYAHGLLEVLGVVWVLTAVWMFIAWRRAASS